MAVRLLADTLWLMIEYVFYGAVIFVCMAVTAVIKNSEKHHLTLEKVLQRIKKSLSVIDTIIEKNKKNPHTMYLTTKILVVGRNLSETAWLALQLSQLKSDSRLEEVAKTLDITARRLLNVAEDALSEKQELYACVLQAKQNLQDCLKQLTQEL